MKRIFVLGSINTDLVINTEYIPEKGETMFGNGFFTAHGGKGANQAVAAARNGGDVIFCGSVGNDIFGQSALESFKKENIDCRNVETIDNVPTGTAIIIVCKGDNRIILDSGANNLISKKQINKFLENAKKGDIFLTQLENPIDIVSYALKCAKDKEMMTVLNPAPANRKIIDFLHLVDILIPNEGELKLLGGEESLSKMVKTLVITLGEKGFQIIENNETNEYPCIKITPIDTTAAGDTFVGSMLAAYSIDKDLQKSAIYGSLAASIACTKKGAQPSIPTRNEVESH